MDRITAEWTPALDPSGRGGIDDASFAPDESQATFTVDVPCFADGADTEPFESQGWNIHRFIAQAIGFTKHPPGTPAVGATPLERHCPARHPLYPHLRASKITRVEGIKEKRRVLSPLSRVRGGDIEIQIFEWYRLTILFQSLPYNVLLDAETTTEKNRYVTEIVQPTAEILTRPGGTFKFVTGTLPAGIDYPQSIGLIYGTYDLLWTWHQVPRTAIFDGMYPTRINALIGKVNDDTVTANFSTPGSKTLTGTTTYSPGLLLLTGAVITPEQAPVVPQLMGLGVFDSPRTYRVEYRLKIDPKGHNLKPYVANNTWYLVTHDGSAPPGGKTIYETADFDLLFTPLIY